MARVCEICGVRAYSDRCVRHKERKPLKRTALPAPTKRIKQKGKVYDEWQATKKLWFKKNYKQHYVCHYCGILLTNETITLDHKISRSGAPHLRADIENLVPCCWACNGLKGSIDHDKYVHVCH